MITYLQHGIRKRIDENDRPADQNNRARATKVPAAVVIALKASRNQRQDDVLDVTPSTVTKKRVDDGNADLDLLHHSKGRLAPRIIVPTDFHDSVMSFDTFPDWGLENDEKKNDLILSSFPKSPQQPPRTPQPLWISPRKTPRRTLSFPTIMEEETDFEIDNNDDHHHNDDDDDQKTIPMKRQTKPLRKIQSLQPNLTTAATNTTSSSAAIVGTSSISPNNSTRRAIIQTILRQRSFKW
jgi:hypothetical protein